MVKAAVIGAGMAGIAAARTLMAEGAEAVVFEATGQIGGRVTSIREGDFLFDCGAQNFAPGDSELSQVMQGLDQSVLLQIQKPIHVHDGHHMSIGDPRKNQLPRWTCLGGAQNLPEMLAAGLDIRLNNGITEICFKNHKYLIGDESFDAVIAAIPIPLAAPLLWGLGEKRSIGQAHYRSCISVQLGYDFPLDLDCCALIDPAGTVPVEWIGFESVKAPDRAPAGKCAVIVQFSAGFSQTSWEWDDAKLCAQATSGLANLLGDKMLRCLFSNVKKWKYSQPEEIAMFATVNPKNERLVLAGDGTTGGRTELAYESGVTAARHILDTFK